VQQTGDVEDGLSHEYTVFADYFQFYIQDDDMTLGLDGSEWTPDAMYARVAISSGVIGVGTARNLDVPVVVRIHDAAPPIDAGASHIVEANLATAAGRLVVAGCTDYFHDAARIQLTPGRYRARVTYSLRAVDDDGFGDHYAYTIEIWPTPVQSPRQVVLQGPEPWSG
jgi:hypothetical protein